MMGTINCVYETPCGWCSKWDKECDKKIPELGRRAKCNPIDDIVDDSLKEALTNKICELESDHEFECCGMSTSGSTYRCRKCGMTKLYPVQSSESITITGSLG